MAASYRLVVVTGAAGEDHTCPPREFRGRARAPIQRLQMLPFGVRQNDGNRWASRAYAYLLAKEDERGHHILPPYDDKPRWAQPPTLHEEIKIDPAKLTRRRP